MNVMNNFVLIAVPLFIFMGYILQEAGIADDLFDTVSKWSGRIRGALGIGTVGICAIMAAMVGISGAATIAMGFIAVPAMLDRNYDKKLPLAWSRRVAHLDFSFPRA